MVVLLPVARDVMSPPCPGIARRTVAAHLRFATSAHRAKGPEQIALLRAMRCSIFAMVSAARAVAGFGGDELLKPTRPQGQNHRREIQRRLPKRHVVVDVVTSGEEGSLDGRIPRFGEHVRVCYRECPPRGSRRRLGMFSCRAESPRSRLGEQQATSPFAAAGLHLFALRGHQVFIRRTAYVAQHADGHWIV